MDTIKFNKINLYLTGYGPFMNVLNNPSQLLVESIIADKEVIEKEKQVEIKYNEIFQVDCDYVSSKINNCYECIDNCSDAMNLIIHFGVYPGGNGILLEKQCKNYICDYKKINGPICTDSEEYGYCKLDLDTVCFRLKSKGHNVNVSTNAGEYLCNYIYFLTTSKTKNCEYTYSVFIHIPPIGEMDTQECKKTVYDFIDEIQAINKNITN